MSNSGRTSGGVQLNGALEGVFYRPFTHSYGNVQAPANCSKTYVERLAGRHVMDLTKRSNNGYWAQDVAGTMMGTGGITTPIGGLVSIDAIQNDMHYNPASAAALSGVKHSIAAMIHRVRLGTFLEETNAAFTFTGVWTALPNSWYDGGNLKFTTAQNAKVDIAVSGATQYVLFSRATKSVHGVGAISVDGVDTGLRIDNSAGTESVTDTSPLAADSAPWALLVTVPDAGAHTITVTKTDANAAGRVFIDGIGPVQPAGLRPLVLVHKQVYLPQPVYDGWATGVTNATVDIWNAAIDTVVAGFADNVLALDLNAMGWDPATMSSTVAGVTGHPDDRGMKFITDCIEAKVPDYVPGLNIGL